MAKMAAEQGALATLEDAVPPQMDGGHPNPAGSDLVDRSEGACETHHSNIQGENGNPLSCEGEISGRSHAFVSGCNKAQLQVPSLWDDMKVLLPSSEGATYPSRQQVSQLVLGHSGDGESANNRLDSRGGSPNARKDLTERDAITTETQRLSFRQFHFHKVTGPREVCNQLWYLCHRWLKPERHSKEQILELLILEQFLAILPSEMQNWVKRNGPESCARAVALAEDFLRRQQEDVRWGEQVVCQETPINPPEAEQILLEARGEQYPPGFKREGSVGTNCTGDGQLNEREEPQLKGPEPVEPGGKGKGRCLLPASEEEEGEEKEEAPSNQLQSEKILGKGPEESVAHGEASDPLADSTKRQKAPKGKSETTCAVCGKSFSRRTGLLAHERVHTGEKPYKCSHCGRSFRSRSTLVVHQRTHTGEKPYRCAECGKSFPVTTQLIEHERTHSGEKPYPCAECGQAFRQRSHLKNHQKIHTGLKPFKCSYCGKGFSISSDLIRHERAHTGEKPYQCPDCGKRFCNSSQVITHRRVHTGEKPYKCLECGKGFTVSQQLIRHQTVHTGEKPYQCLECGKTFGVSTLLAGHLRIHTGEKPYECSECGKCFRLRSTLITHLKIHKARKM